MAGGLLIDVAAAAGSVMDAVDGPYLQEASFAYLTRKATKAETQGTMAWILSYVEGNRRYRPLKGDSLRPDLQKEQRKFGSYLARIDNATSSKYWRCGSRDRQSRHHLVLRCKSWVGQIRVMERALILF